MLSTGTTTFLNHSVTTTGPDDIAASIEPFRDIGLRQVFCKELRLGPGTSEDQAIRDLETTIDTWNGSGQGLVQIGAVVETGAHFVQTGFTTERLIRMASEFAASNGVRLSNHVTGGTVWRSIAKRIQVEGRGDVEHLMSLGALGKHWILVHCTWISDSEIRFCRETGAHIVVCPASAAFTANGAAPIRTFLREGLSLGLGSDGPMVNCSVDMVEQMKHTALLQNVRYLTPGAVSSETLIEMATIGGARALGLDAEIGSLETGKRADMVAFDMDRWHWGVPLVPQSALVFAGKGTDAKHVLVNGSWRVRDGEVRPADGGASWLRVLRHVARARAMEVVERAGIAGALFKSGADSQVIHGDAVKGGS
jgi:5-methylthioadenosine/S-adenosylhomocysteine deaminase